ncbi:ATP-binding protein [Streptomyces sp. NPDC020096]
MRLRPRTIRTQLLVLLLVPMVSLAALWTYSSFTTVRGAWSLIRVSSAYRYYGTPTTELVEVLEQERRTAVEYVASGGTRDDRELAATQRVTDQRVAVLRDHTRWRRHSPTLTADQKARIDELLTGLDGLTPLRAQVRARRTNWSQILDRYSAVIDPGFRLCGSLTELQTGEVARMGSVVVELARARELLSREDAMVTGGRAATGMTDGQYRDLIGTIDGRKLLHQIYAPELPAADSAKLREFENGSVGWSLNSLEESARTATPLTAATEFGAQQWRQTADGALAQLETIDDDAARHVGEEAHAQGMTVLAKAAAVSLAGLAAVIGSLLISLRISRQIAGRLTALRDAAEELSGQRLPEVMRRLREGVPVDDVSGAEDADQFADDELGDDEIGQVGRAFGVAQRAAVRAAVEQARLRRGVSAVFTTLARRSQVLLHRQLTLLDAMERRAEDPAELADLFRLDHMTTRMRRHSEGLLILSGDAPGRAWRRPVRLVEVVQAAVGEVEDYRRIVVHRLPRMALAGAAVADVLHLLAELMENATAFSPPDTSVEVGCAEVSDGFVIRIEDQGLGMSEERLAEANRELRVAADTVDLPETDRLGLFTVGRLAARHGVRVALHGTEHKGTAAEVLLPLELLVPAEEYQDEPDGSAGRLETVGVRAGRVKERAAGDVVVGEGERVGSEGERTGRARDGARKVGVRQAVAVSAEASAAPRASAPDTRTTTAAGLPLRVPRGRVPKGGPTRRLHDEPPTHERTVHDHPRITHEVSGERGTDRTVGVDGKDGTVGTDRERSPEAARSTYAAYARGLARGRSGLAAAQKSREEDGGSP